MERSALVDEASKTANEARIPANSLPFQHWKGLGVRIIVDTDGFAIEDL